MCLLGSVCQLLHGAVAFALPIYAGGKEIESWIAPTLAEKTED